MSGKNCPPFGKAKSMPSTDKGMKGKKMGKTITVPMLDKKKGKKK